MSESIQARLFYEVMTDSFALYIVDDDGRSPRKIATKLEFEEVERGMLADTASLRLGERAAQQLMDDLWAAGRRPTQGRQSEGVTAAQGRHLEDMRALAFAKLNVERPA